jgi:hypothetical protein
MESEYFRLTVHLIVPKGKTYTHSDKFKSAWEARKDFEYQKKKNSSKGTVEATLQHFKCVETETLT